MMDKKKWLMLLLCAVTIAAVGVSIWAVFLRSAPTLAPDYAPQQMEQNAVPMEKTGDDKKLDAPSGGGAVSLTYSRDVSIDLSEKIAKLVFANPAKSTQDMVLQIVIQDTVLVQSGRLSPGNQVTILSLLEGMETRLAPGGYEGKFVVLYYNQETGEKAMLNTEIPVNITVTE